MAIVSIFSASYCHGEEVTAAVTARLGYRRVDDEIVDRAAARFQVTPAKLARTMAGSPPFFNRVTHEHERNLAYLRLALAELVQEDGLVWHGFAGHMLPGALTHALRVCLVASQDYRLRMAVGEGLAAKDALKRISRDDAERIRWTRQLLGQDPYASSLYDILLPMQETAVAAATDAICAHAARPVVAFSPAARQAAADFLLSARVNLALAEEGHAVEVSATEGQVFIGVNKYVVNFERHAAKLEAVARQVAGVRAVRCGPGALYVPPSLVGPQDLEVPTRVLLVDDEREFVHTLSDRLRSRQLAAEVVYDGEQALAVLETEPPDVMVLDLKMPGIDGLEVLRRVKASHPHVEVVILTGHGSDREQELARELGAFAYLTKPVDIDVLARTMREAYRKVNKLPPDGGMEDPQT